MAPKQRVSQALTPLISDASTVCLSCRRNLLSHPRPQSIKFPTTTPSKRTYASAAAAAISESEQPPSSSSIDSSPSTSTSQSPRPTYAISSGIILSRAPILTRPLHPFERAFFLYQKRLNERLALPFTQYFYFKKGTPANLEWKRKMRERRTAARDIGHYEAYSDLGWNDEVVIGSADAKIASEDEVRERLVADVVGPRQVGNAATTMTAATASTETASPGTAPQLTPEEQSKAVQASVQAPAEEASAEEVAARAVARRAADELERPMSRVSQADVEGDQKSLDRLGWRTLYLLVKEGGEKGRWIFPRTKLEGRESLRTAAERALLHAAGPNMNTWIVGNVPVSHYAYSHPSAVMQSESRTAELGEKVFLLKGRIMAGQANLVNNRFGLAEFKWLTKEEIKELVTPSYWKHVESALAER